MISLLFDPSSCIPGSNLILGTWPGVLQSFHLQGQVLNTLCADDKGFVAISATLQCSGGPANVFAVGDVASSAAHPRPKAGVFAVRQGPPLTANLRKWAPSSLAFMRSTHGLAHIEI